MYRFETNQVKHLLCLGAHADDIEIGCGGTLLHLRHRLPELAVTWVVFSASGSRAQEAHESARRWLGHSLASQSAQPATPTGSPAGGRDGDEVRVNAFPDSRFPEVWGSVKSYFEELASGMLQQRHPDLILTHRLSDRHQDHRVIAELTWQTFRNHCIWEYEVPKFEGDLGQPNLYVPLTEAIVDAKCRLLSQGFPSQAHRHWFDEDAFRSLMRIRGVESGRESRYAEAFDARKVIVE